MEKWFTLGRARNPVTKRSLRRRHVYFLLIVVFVVVGGVVKLAWERLVSRSKELQMTSFPLHHPETLREFRRLNAEAEKNSENPRLRHIEFVPARTEAGVVFITRDPLGISNEPLGVTPPGLQLLQLLDGTRTVADIMEQGEHLFPGKNMAAQAGSLVSALDSHYYLFDSRFRSHVIDMVESFQKETLRAPIAIGSSYSSNAEEVKSAIAQYLAGARDEQAREERAGELSAVIAPHIDYQRGHRTYGKIYAELQSLTNITRFIILGTAHNPSYRYFALTRKDYWTSLGRAVTDREFIDRLTRHYPYPLFEDEFLHRGEHSIELQIPFLQYLFGPNVRIVPILCGSLHGFFDGAEGPSSLPEIRTFIAALRRSIQESSGKSLVIAASDLSHMGMQFGDQFLLGDEILSRVRESDRRLLDYIVQKDAAGFIGELARTKNATRVCGAAPIYILLQILGQVRPALVHYQQCRDREGFNTVTIPAVAFYAQP